MSINIIREEIRVLLETLNEQLAMVMAHKNRIPQIEIDIMMSNIRKLYGYFFELNRLNNLRGGYTDITPAPAPVREKAVPAPMPETETVAEIREPSIPVAVPEELPVETTPAPAPELPVLQDPAPEQPQPELKKGTKDKKSAPDLFAEMEKTTVADKFRDMGKSSVHEKISSGNADSSVADKISAKPLKDLKAAIGINDKFLFINELFKGDLQEYNRMIERLNAAPNKAEADLILSEMREKFEWSKKTEVETRLMVFVNRKFMMQ